MIEKTNKNLLPGYAIGGSVFMIIIPAIFYFAAQKLDPYFGLPLTVNPAIRIILSLTLVATGLLFSFWSIIVQNKIGKGGPLEGYKISVSPKTQKLNTTGPYKYTRNPMLFGTCAFYFSLALFFDSPAFLVFAFLFTVFMITFVIRAEEKRLLADFGRDYQDYKNSTSFFIPWPPNMSRRNDSAKK